MRLDGVVHRTPVLESSQMNGIVGGRVRFKCEMFQRGGSHKVRGTVNWVRAALERGPVPGVVTASSGNHGAALAMACAASATPCVVVMPHESNPTKAAATRAYGAEVISDGVDATNREAVADRIAIERVFCRNTADAVDGIAGLGTLGFEVTEVDDVDVVLVPVGLGALLAGVALGVKARASNVRVVGVEPVAGNDVRRSLDAGRIVSLGRPPQTMADGARAMSPSPRTFSMIARLADDVVSVSEEAIADALLLTWSRLKVVAEPTACLSLAAVLTGAVRGNALCVLSGGNVDIDAIARTLVHRTAAPTHARGSSS